MLHQETRPQEKNHSAKPGPLFCLSPFTPSFSASSASQPSGSGQGSTLISTPVAPASRAQRLYACTAASAHRFHLANRADRQQHQHQAGGTGHCGKGRSRVRIRAKGLEAVQQRGAAGQVWRYVWRKVLIRHTVSTTSSSHASPRRSAGPSHARALGGIGAPPMGLGQIPSHRQAAGQEPSP